MIPSEEKKLYQKAIERFGDEQLEMAIEEMSELILAIQKKKRHEKRLQENHNNEDLMQLIRWNDNIAEEIADVEIMLGQLKILLKNENDVYIYKQNKLLRLENKIK